MINYPFAFVAPNYAARAVSTSSTRLGRFHFRRPGPRNHPFDRANRVDPSHWEVCFDVTSRIIRNGRPRYFLYFAWSARLGRPARTVAVTRWYKTRSDLKGEPWHDDTMVGSPRLATARTREHRTGWYRLPGWAARPRARESPLTGETVTGPNNKAKCEPACRNSLCLIETIAKEICLPC